MEMLCVYLCKMTKLQRVSFIVSFERSKLKALLLCATEKAAWISLVHISEAYFSYCYAGKSFRTTTGCNQDGCLPKSIASSLWTL